jgi:hypothetical protein
MTLHESRPSRAKRVSWSSRVWLLSIVLTGVLLSSTSDGATQLGSGTLTFGVGAGTATRDLLSISDIRPVSRGEAVVDVELRYHLGDDWGVGLNDFP